jgi:hypothetical protein
MKRKTQWKFLIILLIVVLLSINISLPGTTVAQVTHNVAVIEVTPYPTRVGWEQNETVDITVVVENQGTETENFSVTVSYDSTIIETQNVTNLDSGTNMILNFAWDTFDIAVGTYSINATASIVPDETVTADNTVISKVYVVSPYIAVLPRATVDNTLTPGKNFTVSIYTNYNGTDIWGWQFSLTYNPNVLNGVGVTNGDLITEAKDDSAEFTWGTFDDTVGMLSPTNAYFFYLPPDEPYVTSGPGILANITFTVVGTGDSDITLVDVGVGTKTKLMGYKDGQTYEIISDYKPDIGHILSGYFRNAVEAVIHDVAILSVTPSNTTVTEGDLVNITVVVENQGTVPETVNVAAYYDKISPNYRIATTKTVQGLEADANASLTFIWNTTDISILGTYSIWAEAGTVLGETDTEDNSHESEDTVTVEALRGQRVPIELAIGIAVVIVLAGAVVLYAVRRRRKPIPE